jgi:hypothetical protein
VLGGAVLGGAVLGGAVLLTTRPPGAGGGPVSVVGLVGLAELEPLPIEPLPADPPAIVGVGWKPVFELCGAGRSKTYPPTVASRSAAREVVVTAGFLSCRRMRPMMVPPGVHSRQGFGRFADHPGGARGGATRSAGGAWWYLCRGVAARLRYTTALDLMCARLSGAGRA